MYRIPASPLPASVYSHEMAARAHAGAGTSANWSAAFAAMTAKRTSKRTARHLGTETT